MYTMPHPVSNPGFEIANWMHLSVGQVNCKNHLSKCTIHLPEIYKANATYVKIRNTKSSVRQVLQVFHLSNCHFYLSQTIGRVEFWTLKSVTNWRIPATKGWGKARKTWSKCVKNDVWECGLSSTDMQDREALSVVWCCRTHGIGHRQLPNLKMDMDRWSHALLTLVNSWQCSKLFLMKNKWGIIWNYLPMFASCDLAPVWDLYLQKGMGIMKGGIINGGMPIPMPAAAVLVAVASAVAAEAAAAVPEAAASPGAAGAAAGAPAEIRQNETNFSEIIISPYFTQIHTLIIHLLR